MELKQNISSILSACHIPRLEVPCMLTLRRDMCMGVTDYSMFNYYWREFNLAIFYDSSNRQIKVLVKFSCYTVCGMQK